MVREKPFKNKKRKLEKNFKEQKLEKNFKKSKGEEKMKEELKSRVFPLNLQLFAEDPKEDKENDETGKKETQQEDIDYYKSLYENEKKKNDLLSKEAKDYKLKLRGKESEEEAKKREEEETKQAFQEELENLRRENKIFKLKSELSKGGILKSKDIEDIVSARYEEDDVQFANSINKIISDMLKEKENSLKSELRKNGKFIDGYKSEKDSEENEIEQMISSINKGQGNREILQKYKRN